MRQAEIERLKAQYTGKHVMVDAARPELARFADQVGQIKTFNFWGRPLVEFPGANRGWYDLELADLRFVDPPAEKPVAKEAAKPVAKEGIKPAAKETVAKPPAEKQPAAETPGS